MGHWVATYWIKTPRGNYQQVQLTSTSCRWIGLYRNQKGNVQFETRRPTGQSTLTKRLAPFGYYPAHHTPGLWMHKTIPISFSLIMDDFTVKYVGKENAEHLRNALLRSYELTTDWGGTFYSGMHLKWDYQNRICDISIPGYIVNVLSKCQHENPKHPQDTNLGDYHTTHHSAQHHKDIRGLILHQANGYMFCEGVLNYSYSHYNSCSPGSICAHTYRHARAPREPHSSEEYWRVLTVSQHIT
jgi:hypothetical protein